VASHKEIIDEKESDLDQLRRIFDQYFQGFERLPPVEKRDRLKYALVRMRGESSRWNTGDRFRLGTLHQKFMTYNRMWERKLKAYEEGTSLRDRQRKRRKLKQEEAGEAPRKVETKKAPTNDAEKERMEKLYKVYMQAKRRSGERSNLTLEKLSAQLKKQIPKLKKKHNCERVDFKVVLKDGKPMLKAVPK